MNRPVVRIERLPHSKGLPLPAYESAGAAGLDLRAALPEGEPLILEPGARTLVPTGLKIALPPDHEAQVRPRSGLAIRHGITLINTPGTIDEDYRGELMIPLVNLGTEAFAVERGMRIAQMVIAPVTRTDVREVETLEPTERGAFGFGSTGTV